MFFDCWLPLLRTAAVGILAYAALVLSPRVSGKRTLSRMNAFDLIVTVALGLTLASISRTRGQRKRRPPGDQKINGDTRKENFLAQNVCISALCMYNAVIGALST